VEMRNDPLGHVVYPHLPAGAPNASTPASAGGAAGPGTITIGNNHGQPNRSNLPGSNLRGYVSPTRARDIGNDFSIT
jgi:hypothetical protein